MALEDEDFEPDPEPEELFEVWPENWPSVQLFLACSGQWRVIAGFGAVAFIDLDFVAIRAAMDMAHVKRADRPQLFADLRDMAQAAAKVINRRRGGG